MHQVFQKGSQVSLNYKVFLYSYLGFNSNSTLSYEARDAKLVDAQPAHR
jgi:hypothetical protein